MLDYSFTTNMIEITKRKITTLNIHSPHSAEFHNIKHIFLNSFMYKQDRIFNVYKTVILIPILITERISPCQTPHKIDIFLIFIIRFSLRFTLREIHTTYFTHFM